MNRLALIVGGFACAAVLGAPPALMAQAASPQRQNKPGGVWTNAELVTLLDAYAIVQAQKTLELNEEQYGRFVIRLKRLQDTRRRNTQARNRAMQELRRLSNDPTTDEGTVRDRLKALRELEDQAALALRREYEALDEVLDPRQQVRFRVFEEQLERRKLDLLIRARERAGRPAPQRRNDGQR
ncbi:MAG: hypothetical protein ACRD15_11510 [Vicinamibacterales bacterium]